MATTINTFADKLAASLGEDFNDFDTGEIFVDYVIEAIDSIFADKSWPFGHLIQSFTTADGTDSYALDTNMADARVVFDIVNNVPLTYVDQDTILKDGEDYDQTGKPTRWYWKTATDGVFIIGLFPVPNADYSLNVYGDKQPEGMIGTTNIPLPQSALQVIRHYIIGRYKEDNGDYAGSQLSQLRFNRSLAALTKRYQAPVARTRAFAFSDVPRARYGFIQFPPNIPAP